MQKKLTISIDEHIYKALYDFVGKRKISRYIEDLVRSKIMKSELENAYKLMASDKNREKESLEWVEGTFGDFSNETW